MTINEDMKSKAFQVRPDSPSLRATIPLGVVQTLKIKHGDVLTWEIEARDGKLVAMVRKEKEKA